MAAPEAPTQIVMLRLSCALVHIPVRKSGVGVGVGFGTGVGVAKRVGEAVDVGGADVATANVAVGVLVGAGSGVGVIVTAEISVAAATGCVGGRVEGASVELHAAMTRDTRPTATKKRADEATDVL